MHPVEANLEVGDATAFAFPSLQVDQKPVGVFRQGAQLVEVGIKASGYDPAVADQHRR